MIKLIIKSNVSNNYIEYDYSEKKVNDIVIVLPGGGYNHTSIREGNIVKNKFLENNFHSGVFYYCEDNLKFPKKLEEMDYLINEINKDENINNIYLCGFSAGGHLAGIYSAYYKHKIKKLILCYPVVTSGVYRHKGSFLNLLDNEDDYKKVSLEKLVDKDFPEVFLWHTRDDQSVNIKNSLLLINSLVKNNIVFESHIYKTGKHGLSLGTKEVAFDNVDKSEFEKKYLYLTGWFDLAINFIKG